MENDDDGKTIEKIGINVRRHKELISRLSELVDTSDFGPYMTTLQLIDLIADEPTFSKKECVYLGLYLASTNQSSEH